MPIPKDPGYAAIDCNSGQSCRRTGPRAPCPGFPERSQWQRRKPDRTAESSRCPPSTRRRAGDTPVFMFFHGGGWVLGDFQTHARLVRDLVNYSGATAVFVNYTPSPEAGYGVAINQAYAATKWVAARGREIKVDGSHLAVAGNSVGGNMAAVVSLMAKNQGQPKIRHQVLLWPVADANFDTESYNQFANGYFLTTGMMKWFWDNYTTDASKRADITASPATAAQLQGLPPALKLR